MSSSAVAELEASLQAMLSLKPPGVSGSRIANLTVLCNENVQSESVLVQKLYTHFRKTPGTHKLGVLYVVDSVTRKWTEQAKSAGQPINSSAPDGTYAAGVHRVKELLPALMNDIITTAPVDQKEKIKKMIDIWEKGQTFPLQMLSTFRTKLNSQNASTTPPGSPPAHVQGMLQNLQSQPTAQAPAAPAAQPDTRSILEALANMARQNNAASPAAPISLPQPVGNPYNVANAQSTAQPPQIPVAVNQTVQYPPLPPVNAPIPQATFQQQPTNGATNYPSNPPNPFAPAAVAAPNSLTPALQQQLILAKALADQGLSHDSIAGILNMMGNQGLAAPQNGTLPPPPLPPHQSQLPLQSQVPVQNGWQDTSRDNYHHADSVRSPPRYRRRSRSPSPRGWDSHNRQDGYDHGDGWNRGDDRRGYRQRSPQRRQSSTPPASGEKWVGYDESIGRGNIKVLSRTLFVGGVTSGESELRRMFEAYGRVQTCIVNKDKRHAFVKMASRADAVAAKEAMEKNRSSDSQLRTRWGVGFGPRECSDYQTGVSIIPITKLTDADRKWMLTAEYGGSGGKPIEQYMVVEEPDIEIGQGVSSKAISRRLEKTGKPSREENDNSKWKGRDNKRGGDEKKDRFSAVNGPTPMPAIPPFGIPGFPGLPTLPNGMPMFPPGFVFPGQTATPQQPPPPGR